MSITIKTIAESCNLSPITVSRALRGDKLVARDTRELVRKVANRIGYHGNLSARNLRVGKTYVVTAIVNDYTNEFLGGMLRGIQQELYTHGYQLITLEWGENEPEGLGEKYLETIIGRGSEGVIMARWGHEREMRFFTEILNRRIPIVAIDRQPNIPGIPFVGTNDKDGGFMATEYLISQGHTRIGHLSGPLSSSPAKERLLGFYEAMASHGLLVRSEWVLEADWSGEIMADRFFNDLFESSKGIPTAFFAATDTLAAFLVQKLAKCGFRVPDDVSIVGFTDERIASLINPPLTTVRQYPIEIGRQSVKLLLETIEDGGIKARAETIDVRIKTCIVERESVCVRC